MSPETLTALSKKDRPSQEAKEIVAKIKQDIDGKADAGAKEQERKAREQQLLQELEQSTIDSEVVREGIIRGEKKAEFQQEIADATLVTAQTIEAIKQGVIVVSEPQQVVIVELGKYLKERNAPFLTPIIRNIIRKPNYLQLLPTQDTTLQEDVKRLVQHSSGMESAQAVVNALREAVRQNKVPGMTEHLINERLMRVEVPIQQHRESNQEREQFLHLLGLLPNPVEKELLAVVFYPLGGAPSQEVAHMNLNRYMETLYNGDNSGDTVRAAHFPGLINEGKKFFGDTPKAREHAMKRMSEELRNRITLLLGYIYQPVDESEPKEQWGHAQGGDPYFNTGALAKLFLKRLYHIRDIDFSKLTFVKNENIKFYARKQVTRDEIYKGKPRFPVKDPQGNVIDDELFAEPRVISTMAAYYDLHEVGAKDFFTEINNEVEEVENSHRAFFHDMRAGIYMPAPDDGYYAAMARAADAKMHANDYDGVMHMPDADLFMQAGSLIIKYLQADFARYDWIHQPASVAILSDLKMTAMEAQVFRDMKEMYPNVDDRRIRRALIMAIGDCWSMYMGYIETNALADPPRDPNGNPDYTSFDKGEAARSGVFNPLWQQNLRFEAEGLVWAYLLFMQIRGKKGEHIFKKWNHNDLRNEMAKVLNSYITGKPPEDADPDVKRFVDQFNMGNVGSMYTRGGWRMFHMYEYAMVRPKSAAGGALEDLNTYDNIDVTESFKAIENMGVEVMKHFLSGLGDSWAGKFFEDNNVAARKTLVYYIYNKYFDLRKQGVLETLPAFETFFTTLESSKTKSEAYKEFFYKTLSRAVVKRAPTKMLRMERNRETTGRSRAWQIIFRRTGLQEQTQIHAGHETITGLEAYDRAVKDICMVESQIRHDISHKIDEAFKAEKEKGMNKISDELNTSASELDHYEVTPEKIKLYMTKMIYREEVEGKQVGKDHIEDITEAHYNSLSQEEKDRIQRALKVYGETMKFYSEYNTEKKINYIDDFAKRYEKGKEFYFKVAFMPEEIMREALNHARSGPTMPKRVFGDINVMEQNVVKGCINELYGEMVKAATSHKHDMEALGGVFEKLKKAKDAIKGVHSEAAADEFVSNMSRAVIAFFRKDSEAMNIWTRWKYTGRYKSLSQELLEDINVWAWDMLDVRDFVHHLHKKDILPYYGTHRPLQPGQKPKTKTEYRIDIKLPFFNKHIQLLPHEVDEHVIHNTGHALLEEFASTPLMEMIFKAAPPIAIALLAIVISFFLKGYKMASGGK